MTHPIQIADLAYLPLPAAEIAAVISRAPAWPRWFPHLHLTVTENRGDLGIRWAATGVADGTSEIWLEKLPDGTNIHYFLHAAPSGTGRVTAQAKRARQLTMFYRVQFRNLINELRQLLDGDRPAGEDPRAWRAAHPRGRATGEELSSQ